jgi:hypothetical protein
VKKPALFANAHKAATFDEAVLFIYGIASHFTLPIQVVFEFISQCKEKLILYFFMQTN